MGIFFSGRELIDIAIGIEQNGAIFYDTLAGTNRDAAIRNVFKYLADREREHLKTFQAMLGTVGEYQPPEGSEEQALYLKVLVDSAIFRNDEAARKLAEKACSDAEAIQIGIGAEKDSIIFYTEMRELVRRSDRGVVERILEEEKSHLRQLSDLEKSLCLRR